MSIANEYTVPALAVPRTEKAMKATGWLLGTVAIGALAAMPFVGNAYLTTIIFGGLIAYILAQSWDWVAGEMGYVNLGHYCFYGIGAYGFAIALTGQWPFAVALVFAVLITGVVALFLSVPLFRLHGDYFAFGTLALLPLMEVLAYNLTSITKGGDGIVLPVAQVLQPAYLLALTACIVTFLVTRGINRVRFGYALKSIRNDEQVAETVGVRIAPVKRKVLVLSAVFGGLAGALQAWQMSYIDPATVFGLNVALVPVAMVLFAGSGLRWGPLVGVVVLACMQQWLLVNVQGYQAALYGLTILLIGRFMPGGFMRAKWVRRVPLLSSLAREHHEYNGESPTLVHTNADLPLPRLPVSHQKPLIELQSVCMQFGGNVAVNDISLKIMQGEIVGLIGPNGSGKTTLFNCISRVYTPTSGRVMFAGQDLSHLGRDRIARLGVGRTYQIPRPFGDLTVQENIAIPLMFGDDPLSPRDALREARAFVEYADLSTRLLDRADALSMQEKKALEFARALACKPRLLLVDEVASGLTPAEVKRFVEHIRHVRDRYGITVIWVEHIFSALEQVVDRVVVLEQGSLIADGALADVVKDERVLRTYLGTAAGAHAPQPVIGPLASKVA
jgi:branched-chain amino acid transport system permease protein